MANLTAKDLKKMYINGSNQLFNKYKKIDSLNVFPVPDGDTGTNINFTISSGVKKIIDKEFDSVSDLAKVFAKGTLMGARGNSGVIMSQILKGFANGLDGLIEATPNQIALAFRGAATTAYNSVGSPVEGTMLTVIREIAEALEKKGNFEGRTHVLLTAVEEGNASVTRTPELLPVLKEAGVVDSGAYGLMEFIYGMLAYVLGKNISREEKPHQIDFEKIITESDHNGQFGYCTEFVVLMTSDGQEKVANINLFAELDKIGDSVAVVIDDEILKIHVHTLKPEDAMQIAHQFGEFHSVKIENMSEQVDDRISGQIKRKELALIAVSNGEGLNTYFRELNVDGMIYGGQTMNPSTEDFIEAIKNINANKVIILPNNKNILMAAKQAAQILNDIDVEVIETKTIPQGIVAASMYNFESSFKENIKEMNEAIIGVRTAQITTAVKDTTFEGLKVHEGNYISMVDGKIISSKKTQWDCISDLIDTFDNEGFELITVISGDGAMHVDETLELLKSKGVEVEHVTGGQAVYPYIFGAEK